MSRAVENIALLVESGDYDASIELLKITGMYRGLANQIGEQDSKKTFDTIVEQRLAAEQIPDVLIGNVPLNLEKKQRREEIQAGLMRDFGEEDGAKTS
jgi:hypothetical protein